MFLNPLGLLALLGVPAVIALHLFRRRFERQRVSALFLWESRSTTSLSGRRRERLLRSPSFWSELLLALLLALAFAGPRACGTLEARHLVVVLDGSASMSAPGMNVDGPGPSPAELTVAALRDSIDDLSSGSRVTVIESGAQPRILIGPAAFPQEAAVRLNEYQPRASRHDIGPSTALAMEVAGEGAVTVYTDRFVSDPLPEQVSLIALGAPRENLAITRATRTIVEDSAFGEEEVLLSVTNFSPRARSTKVELLQDGEQIAEESFQLPPGGRKHLRFVLAAESPLVHARLEGDTFPIDDEAILAPAPPRRLAIAAELAEGEARFLGLERAESGALSQWLALIPRSDLAGSLQAAHLVLAHETLGGPGTWCLTFEQGGDERFDLFGPFLIEKRHRLLEGISLDGVVWSASDMLLPGTPLISAGNLPLLTEELRESRRVFHMNIDWTRSSLQRTPDWPILLDNLSRLRREELSGARQTSLALGEVFYYQTDAPGDYVLEGPDGSRDLKALGALAIEGIDTVGEYRLLQDGRELVSFAVHFGDDRESDLRDASRGEQLSAVELAEQESGSSWVVLLLGTLALAALLLDWWFLRSRATQDWVPLPTKRTA